METRTKSRTQKFLYNSTASALLQIIRMIAALITPRIMLSVYGSEINGLVSSVTQFISYFTLVDAGLSRASVFALYKPLSEADHAGISSIVAATKKYYARATVIFAALVVALSVFYPLYVKTYLLSKPEVGILVLLMGVSGVLNMALAAKYRALLTADQRNYVISLTTICTTIFNTLIVIVMARSGYSVIMLKTVALLSVFSGVAILLIYCKAHYRFLDSSAKPDWAALKNRGDALFLEVLGLINRSASVVILTLVVKDLMIVSVFTVYNMVMSSLNSFLEIFRSGLPASFGEVIAKGEKRTLQKSYKEFELIFYLMLTVVYAVAFVTIVPFVEVYTKGITDVNYVLPMVGALFVLDGLLHNLKTPQGMLVISAGMFRETRRQTTIQGAIMVVLGVVLAFFLGMYGVLIASIVANLYRCFDLLFFIPKHVTDLPVRSTFFRMLRVFLSGAIIVLPSFFIAPSISGYLSWCLLALGYFAYGCLITVLLGILFERKEMTSVFHRIRRIISR